MNTHYLRIELIRLLRNRQNFIFSLIFPVVLYLFIAGQNRHGELAGIPFPAYYLAGMIAFGGMGATVSGGARIAFEREQGWTRQLRISPMSPASYLRIKVISSYVIALLTIGAVYLAALSYGVRMPLVRWGEMTGLILVALVPFAALGVLIGHVIKSDSIGPVMGGGMSLLAVVGGAFGPLGSSGSIAYSLSELTPAFWIVQAGQTSVGGSAWGVRGWVTVAIWAAVLGYGALWAYRRDSGRV